jgi:hypothetical protein
MSETKISRIILTKDGSFTDRSELVFQFSLFISKVFYIRSHEKIRLSLSSKKFKEKTPYIISNLALQKKSRSKNLNLVEIKQACKVSKAEFKEKYDCYTGTFDAEGVWSLDLQFDTPGSYFFQTIFIPMEESIESDVINILGTQL